MRFYFFLLSPSCTFGGWCERGNGGCGFLGCKTDFPFSRYTNAFISRKNHFTASPNKQASIMCNTIFCVQKHRKAPVAPPTVGLLSLIHI